MPLIYSFTEKSEVEEILHNFDESELWVLRVREEKPQQTATQIAKNTWDKIKSYLGIETGGEKWDNFDTFTWVIPPREIEEEYEISTVILPTQSDIPYVESAGIQFSTITLTGTFGFQSSPLVSFTPALQFLVGTAGMGRGGFAYKLAKGLSLFGNNNLLKSFGFAQIMKLRAILWKFANDRATGKRTIMELSNPKTGFNYIAEPLTFRITRSSRIPLHYEYSLTMRIIKGIKKTGELSEKTTFEKILGYVQGVLLLASVASEFLRDIAELPRRVVDRIIALIGWVITPINQLVGAINKVREMFEGFYWQELGGRFSTLGFIFDEREWEQLVSGIKRKSQARDDKTIKEQGSAIIEGLEVIKTIGNNLVFKNEEIRNDISKAINDTELKDLTNNLSDKQRMNTYLSLGRIKLLIELLTQMAREKTKKVVIEKDGIIQILKTLEDISGVNMKLVDKALGDTKSPILSTSISPSKTQVITQSNITTGAPVNYTIQSKEVGSNQTIEDIATDIYGDPKRKNELIQVNNLKYPYISKEGGDGVLKPGDKIYYYVPVSEAEFDINQSRAVVQTKYRKKDLIFNYGVDLAIDNEGNLIQDAFGDLQLVADLDNVRQSLMNRLTTPLGSYFLHKDYGSPIVVGEKMDMTTISVFISDLMEIQAQDPRIESLIISNLRFVEDKIELTLNVKLKGGEMVVV